MNKIYKILAMELTSIVNKTLTSQFLTAYKRKKFNLIRIQI